ncbi:PDZ domain-containing protein [Thermobifida alba]|uniref:PDZ domain-containing protein n=1 Tax=Thermobifida alba TaxID=53522 RepID=A0ABY4L595_THEAE|nr:trypsin-like peptidase domain-containing protein [Thermobifida alba]UPT22861.1 PDZ domain-containing protein [Thermobifida alba]
MSAIDRGSGSSMEEPERPEGPPADAEGRDNTTDAREDTETGSAAHSEVRSEPRSAPTASDPSPSAAPAPDPAAPASDPHPDPRGTPGAESSGVPWHPAPHQAPVPPGHAAYQPAPGQGAEFHGSSPYPGQGAAPPADGAPWSRQPEWFERAAAHQARQDQPTGGWSAPHQTGAFPAYGGGFPPPHGGPAPGAAPRRGGRVVLVAAVTALLTSLVVGPTASVATAYLLDERTDNGPAAASTASGDVTGVANRALPSVVSIATAEGGGSGFIISDDGLIVTNNHVVSGPRELTVLFNDGSQAPAEVVGTDPVSDLAVIQAEGVSGLTPASLGDSDQVEVGAKVVAIGSPLGLSGTVTSGVISALERPVNTGISGQQPDDPFAPRPDQDEPQATTSTVIDAIQTDAPINPGNSGGPLMNMDGEVIGINTAIATTSGSPLAQSGSIGLGFAIPINQAKPIIDELVATGEATYAAIEASVTAAESGPGAELVEVNRGGAADKAGLRSGDVIIRAADRTVTDPNVLIAEIRSHRPGDTITVTYKRDGRTGNTQVTLAAQSLGN